MGDSETIDRFIADAKPLSPERIAQMLADREKENAELRARSKPLHELVVTEKFTVEDVVAASYATSIAPMSEMVLEGESRQYAGGYSSKITLTVNPYNPQVPITSLTFAGFSGVRAGDTIEAKIPCYEEKKIYEFNGELRRYGDQDEVVYLVRSFKDKETAIELKLISPEGKTLRTERAVDYNFYKEK